MDSHIDSKVMEKLLLAPQLRPLPSPLDIPEFSLNPSRTVSVPKSTSSRRKADYDRIKTIEPINKKVKKSQQEQEMVMSQIRKRMFRAETERDDFYDYVFESDSEAEYTFDI